jgi:hypothetical protein
MATPLPAQTEREKLLHEMSTLLMALDADAQTIAPYVTRSGVEILDSMQESTGRLVALFRRLRHA